MHFSPGADRGRGGQAGRRRPPAWGPQEGTEAVEGGEWPQGTLGEGGVKENGSTSWVSTPFQPPPVPRRLAEVPIECKMRASKGFAFNGQLYVLTRGMRFVFHTGQATEVQQRLPPWWPQTTNRQRQYSWVRKAPGLGKVQKKGTKLQIGRS